MSIFVAAYLTSCNNRALVYFISAWCGLLLVYLAGWLCRYYKLNIIYNTTRASLVLVVYYPSHYTSLNLSSFIFYLFAIYLLF